MTDRNFDDVRREQRSEGARMARDDQPDGRVWRKGPGPSPSLAPNSTKRPPKSKGAERGHERFLKDLEFYKTPVEVRDRRGDRFTATIKTSDKFTITFRMVDVEMADEYVVGEEWVIFKHDLRAFRSLSGPPKSVTGDA